VRPLAVIGRVLEGFDEGGRPIWHEGMLVEGGVVRYLGPNPEARAGPGAEVLEVEGVVLPGFTDSHAHILELGLAARTLDLRDVDSIEELKRRVAAAARRLGPGAWVLGRGWDQERFREGRWPTRWDLDEAAPSNPVLLVRVCGHAAVANTLALRAAGITDSTPDPPGGIIEREGGRVTGVLKEAAVQLVRAAAQRGSAEELVSAGVEALLASGITCVHAMSVGAEELEALRALAESGRLGVRVRAYLDPGVPDPRPLEVGNLRVVGVKVFADGSFGARTAALREPYSDAPDSTGTLLMDGEAIERAATEARRRGLQLAVHAIGDRALEEVIRGARAAPRWVRVEHASLAPPDLVEGLAELGLPVSAQPRFVLSDWWIVSRLGGRARWAYPFRSLLSRGVTLSFSSDAPVEPCNPWEGVYAAVTRGALEGLAAAPLWASEAISVEEAVRCYTETAHRVSGDRLGRLSVGFPADFVVLDRDPFELAPSELREVRVVATFVGGRLLFDGRRERGAAQRQ